MKRTFAIFMLMVIETILVIMISYGHEPIAQDESLVPSCDRSLLDHIYHPNRLQVKDPCASVTGTIVDATRGRNKDGCRHEADGDGHCWLKLDPGGEHLLALGNIQHQGGNLVFEPICRYPVTQADAMDACLNWKQKLILPPIGSHVRITGAFVFDSQHGHNEIHPVTEIKVVK